MCGIVDCGDIRANKQKSVMGVWESERHREALQAEIVHFQKSFAAVSQMTFVVLHFSFPFRLLYV